ncbi:MAG: glycosyltransferase family 9 protein [Sedimentisphaeraceae bacterium JB056]
MNYERILIVKPSAIGDITTALPSLHSLRKAYPDAHISWLVRKEFAPLIANHPELDEVIIFDRKLLSRWWRDRKSFSELKELVGKLRDGSFDLVLDLQGLFRSGILTWLTRSKNRFGMQTAREMAPIFYTKKVSPPENSRHVIDYYQKIVAQTGAEDVSVEFILPPEPEAMDYCVKLLKDNGVDPDNFRIFVAGASEPNKCWQSEKFGALAEKIVADNGGQIVIVGTPADTPAAKEIISTTDAPVVDLTGKTNLPQLVALMHMSKLIISNDTGPGHIAIATKRPAVIIFGYTNPIRLYPYNRMDAMAVNDFDGRGLKLRSSDPKHSIKQITLQQVYEKVLLQQNNQKI